MQIKRIPTDLHLCDYCGERFLAPNKCLDHEVVCVRGIGLLVDRYAKCIVGVDQKNMIVENQTASKKALIALKNIIDAEFPLKLRS